MTEEYGGRCLLWWYTGTGDFENVAVPHAGILLPCVVAAKGTTAWVRLEVNYNGNQSVWMRILRLVAPRSGVIFVD